MNTRRTERRKAVAELAAGGMSQRAIGKMLGVDHKTVHGDLGIYEHLLEEVLS